MRDVAAGAGVSFKTVSRVVNNEGGVRSELVQRVERAIADLGYHPDDRARRLRQRGVHTGTIGFVLVDVANPFFSSILRGIEEVATQQSYLVLAGSTDGLAEREDQLVEAFVARRLEGLIVVSSRLGDGPLGSEIRRGTPVVFVDLEPEDVAVDLVRSDHRGGAAAATEHLRSHGHRDIAFFGDDASVTSAEQRRQGYLDVMGRAGFDVPAHRVVQERHTSDDWRAIISEYLGQPDPPTALFTAQNFITIGAVRALHDLGLHETIAQVGFDDVDLADVTRPGISVVPQDPRGLGRRAAERLFARVQGLDAPVIRDIVGVAVVERGSGEIPPFR